MTVATLVRGALAGLALLVLDPLALDLDGAGSTAALSAAGPNALARFQLPGPSPFGPGAASSVTPSAAAPGDTALVVLFSTDLDGFQRVLNLVERSGGEVPLAYPPNAFIAILTPDLEWALRRYPGVYLVERGVTDPASLVALGGQAQTAARIWNTVFRGVPDPILSAAPAGPPPVLRGPDARVAPPEAPAAALAPGAPSSTQTSEFMAGKVVYSVVFVESNGGTGNCSPADTQTENWTTGLQSTVLSEISTGLAFWTSRTNRPKSLTFVLDNQGTRFTSCEPIRHPSTDEGLWTADVLTAMGFPATPSNYFGVARSFANSRRAAFVGDWAYLLLVVNSVNDADGQFSDGAFAYAYLSGPFAVFTTDNDGWGIGNFHLVAAHESGHIFGALDEYAASGCSTADSWGYLNVKNASCNNGGITSDVSIMGESFEVDDPSVDVSSSARSAIGWRNPTPIGATGKAVVDVVRTATASLTPFTPDPTADTTPTYSATAGNAPFPPGGCNTLGGICRRTPSAVSISRVANAKWKLDSGAFTSEGVVPSDGTFNEETGEAYTFTPTSPVPAGTHFFRTISINNFSHRSVVRSDRLTISP